MTAYHIGQMLPAATVPTIEAGPEGPPTWHCVIVPPQGESKARAYFRQKGLFAFYPSELFARTIRGRKVEFERPYIPGMVYLQARRRMSWHVLKARRIISGVMCRSGVPVVIHKDVIRHLQGLTVEAEKLAAARAEMMKVRAGDTATIIAGPLAGLAVEVGEITGKEAWLKLPFGGRVKASLASLERQIPTC